MRACSASAARTVVGHAAPSHQGRSAGRPTAPAPRNAIGASASSRRSVATAAAAGSVRQMSSQMRDVRAQMEEDENLRVLMQSLRGSNLNDADFADSSVQMRLVEVEEVADGEALPLVYDPAKIEAFWSRRPVAVTTRILQLLGISSGFLSSLLSDYLRGTISDTQQQVARAIQLRDIMTSLGPAYIKLGQALSIRPDLLSPAAMNEMQKLCDKVPSFDSGVAMELINQELGRPWQEVYSELRCLAGSLTTNSTTDWSQASSQQHALDAAEQGLPGPEALEQLRSMSLEQAVQFYNIVVSQVRDLLHRIDQGPDSERAREQLEEMFSLEAEKGGTFGYLQVVNPEVFAELMQAKLDPSSPVDRHDPTHWRSVLAAMSLTQEQEAELILLLQSHLKQAEQIVQRKSQVMQQLAAELSNGLLSLELSTTGSGELSAALSGSTLSEEGEMERAASEGTLPAQAELDRLIQLEYWLKYDFTGCVRKLLPARQQAQCMVASYPFYPDQRQLEGAIKDKAGQLWEQLQRAA